MDFVSAKQFKLFHALPARTKSAAGPLGVRKQSIERVAKLSDRTLGFTISTGVVDRDQDCINPKGWDFAHYQRNPVVLWSHKAEELPIGKTIDIGRDDHRLYASVEFLPGGYGAASDLADCVYRMAADGFISATSVGFRPIKWDFSNDPERDGGGWMPGIDFDQQELVELSLVSVPSNPEALIDNAIPIIEPGGGDNDSAPVIVPAPVQVVSFERYRRRARAALLGVFAPAATTTADEPSAHGRASGAP
jgi:HK97 family phage prohead protease